MTQKRFFLKSGHNLDLKTGVKFSQYSIVGSEGSRNGPLDIYLSSSNITTYSKIGFLVGNLSADKPNCTFSLVDDHMGSFVLNGTGLHLDVAPGNNASYRNITVRAANSSGTFDKTFTIPTIDFVSQGLIAEWSDDDLADGAVSIWRDRVSGAPLRQGTSASQPVKSSTGVYFDGVNDFLMLSNSDSESAGVLGMMANGSNSPWTIIAVWEVDTAPASLAQELVSLGTSSAIHMLYRAQVDSYGTTIGNGSHTTNCGFTPGTTVGQMSVTGISFNGYNPTLQFNHWINGHWPESTSQAPLSSTDISLSTSLSSTLMYIGRRAGSSAAGYFQGKLRALRIFNRDMDNDEHQWHTAQLAAKYGITVSLPIIDNPKKSMVLKSFEDFDESVIKSAYADDFTTRQGWYIGMPAFKATRNTYGSQPNLPDELAWYGDPRHPDLATLGIYDIDDSSMVLSVFPRPDSIPAASVGNLPYIGCALVGYGLDEWENEAGYWEFLFKVDSNKRGAYGMLWFLDSSNRWPFEMDLLEQRGAGKGQIGPGEHVDPYMPAPSGATGKSQLSINRKIADLSDGWHTLGAKFDQKNKKIIYYSDGQKIGENQPLAGMYGVTIDDGGSGYEYPQVVITGTGTGAAATAILNTANGSIKSITMVSGGSGYTSDTTSVVISGGTNDTIAQATAVVVNGVIVAINLTNVGDGYLMVNVAGDNVGQCLVGIWGVTAGVITEAYVYKSGSGFTTVPTLTVTGGKGSGARLTALIDFSGLQMPPEYFCSLYPILIQGAGSFTGTPVSSETPFRMSVGSAAWYAEPEVVPDVLVNTNTAFENTVTAQANLIIARMAAVGGAASTGRQAYIRNVVRNLMAYDDLRHDTIPAAGNTSDWDVTALQQWQSLRCLYMVDAESQAQALVNWINPGTNDLTIHGSPVFTPGVGFQVSATDYLDTEIAGSSSDNLIRNQDHHLCIDLTSQPTNTSKAPLMGFATGLIVNASSTTFDNKNFSSATATGSSMIQQCPPIGDFTVMRGWRPNIRVYSNGKSFWNGYVVGEGAPAVPRPSTYYTPNTVPTGTLKIGGGAAFGFRMFKAGRRLSASEIRIQKQILSAAGL